MAPQLKIAYGEQPQVSISAELLGVVRKLHDTKVVIKRELKLPEEEYNLYDAHGLIENDIDLQRTFHKFNKGEEDCVVEVRNSWEHNHFMRIRRMEDHNRKLEERLTSVEATMTSSDEKTGFVGHTNKIEDLQRQIMALVERVVVTEMFPSQVHEPVISATEELKASRDQSLKAIEELTRSSQAHAAEAQSIMARVSDLEAAIKGDMEQSKQDLLNLQRSLQGTQPDVQVKDVQVKSRDVIPVVSPTKKTGWSSKDELDLKIKTDGQTYSMKVETTDTIALVKAMLQGKLDIHRKQQDLQFEGKPLEDNQLVSHYNIPSNSTLQLLVRE